MTNSLRFRSLRWQLPLSYVAIALLAVLALGIALLGTLREFYREQEMSYLTGNAAAIAEEIVPLLATNERLLLRSQIDAFAFLTQTRIQVLDAEGQTILADSGELDSLTPAISVNPDGGGLLDSLGFVANEVTIVVEQEKQNEDGALSSQTVVTRTSQLSAQGSLYGFNLGETPTAASERSNLAVEMSIIDEFGDLIGRVQLSQGPAYGSVILRSVAWGWAIAGTAAILLAALIGWLVSRRLTQPLIALTAVTGRMADGDLGARTNVRRADELGILGHSFNRMAEQVENTVNSLRQFTADAAHELYTPLTALQTDLQLLDSDADLAQQQRVARAQYQAQRLQGLADSLLELSRLEAESGQEELPLLFLNQLVQTAGELYASQAEQADLGFEMHVPDRRIMVRGDDSQLPRALINVLDNSLKFTPSPGRIVLSLAVEDDMAVITVRDTGISIPQEDLPQLFNRFHRGRNTADYPGNGLGLAIVQEIMIRHDGRVTIESGSWGTEVQLILPGDSLTGRGVYTIG